MDSRVEPQDALRAVGELPDEAIDLAGTALLLASFDRPRVGIDRYRAHLDMIASDLRAEVADRRAPEEDRAALDLRLEALRAVLVQRHGYRGDDLTYDDLQNANLMRVIDRRRGLPVALAILYIHAARSQGWAVQGINFPGHFLVRLSCGTTQAIFDPFHSARTLEAADLRSLLKASAGSGAELVAAHYAPIGNRDLLLRLQNNLKIRLLQNEEVAPALEVVERMLLFAPQEASLWREASMLNAKLGNLRAATTALETFIARSQSDAQRHRAALLLQELKARLN